MKRREFMILVAGASAWLLPWMRPARAQNPAHADQAAPHQIGQVATLQGNATVTRDKTTTAIVLQVDDPVFKNDTLATAANATLGVTFDDQTTFSLSANTRIVVNEFVYDEGGGANAASFNVAAGTAAFVAALVAKTGNMKITTPVATLGIRGTTGVIDVPEQGGAAPGGAADEPRIKLYADADGAVGQIEVFNPQGGRLGALTQRSSAFVFRPGAGGTVGGACRIRFQRRRLVRDRGVLRRLFATHISAVARRPSGCEGRTSSGTIRGDPARRTSEAPTRRGSWAQPAETNGFRNAAALFGMKAAGRIPNHAR